MAWPLTALHYHNNCLHGNKRELLPPLYWLFNWNKQTSKFSPSLHLYITSRSGMPRSVHSMMLATQIRLDNLNVPRQCTGNSCCFSPGKASSHSTALSSFFFFLPCVQCFRVFIPPAVRPTLLRQMDIWYLTCAHIFGACRTHDRAQIRLHKSWPSGTENLFLTPRTPPGDRTQGLRIFFLRSSIGGGSVCDRF